MPVPDSTESTSSPAADLATTLRTSFRDASAVIGGGQHRFKGTINVPFLLRHHAKNWVVETEGLDGPTLLPEIGIWPIMPGSNGVRTLDEGESPVRAYEDAMQRAERDGWVYLDPADQLLPTERPPNVGPGGYLRSIPVLEPMTRRQGECYREAWDVPDQPFPDEPVSFVRDERARGAYNRWRKRLVDEGVISPPSKRIIDRMQDRLQSKLREVASRQHYAPDVREAKVAAKRTELEQLEAAAGRASQTKTAAEPKGTGKPKGPAAKSGKED